jgi:predicted AAA+ superfamily ATPase
MKIKRYYQLDQYIKPNKALIIFGPRQVGKTTLLKDYLSYSGMKYKLDSGDNIKTRQILGSEDFDILKEYVQGYDIIAIDEAQKIPGVGTGLKILVDQVPGIRIVVTGSSSFELAGQVGEPLTGRKNTLTLYPIAQIELANKYNHVELRDRLNEWLVYGGYPEVVTTPSKQEKARLLEELVHSYLLKDILELEKVKSSRVLLDLLRLLAFQIGCEVSLSELAQRVGLDAKTVGRYLDLFEKSFVIYNVRAYGKNLRNEISRKSKYYFFDNGIRNAVISHFNDISLRNDQGQLWENFMVMERLKKRTYKDIFANHYFWRTYDQKEMDLIEEREGKLFGYEFKWGDGKSKSSTHWINTYPEASYEKIDHKNYLPFVL